MKCGVPLIIVALSACVASGSERAGTPSPKAQAIVDRVANEHADVARLSIHTAVRRSGWRIVASTVKGRVGDRSDPEDESAAKTGEPVVLSEGRNVDYTLPVRDDSGRTIAIVGLTISGAAGGDQGTLLARAKALAEEIAAEIRAMEPPLP
jgi:hypothetical protein